jgi:hypothetical protein
MRTGTLKAIHKAGFSRTDDIINVWATGFQPAA